MITGYEGLFSIPMESTSFLPPTTRLSGFGIPGIGDVPNDLMLILISARHSISTRLIRSWPLEVWTRQWKCGNAVKISWKDASPLCHWEPLFKLVQSSEHISAMFHLDHLKNDFILTNFNALEFKTNLPQWFVWKFINNFMFFSSILKSCLATITLGRVVITHHWGNLYNTQMN